MHRKLILWAVALLMTAAGAARADPIAVADVSSLVVGARHVIDDRDAFTLTRERIDLYQSEDLFAPERPFMFNGWRRPDFTPMPFRTGLITGNGMVRARFMRDRQFVPPGLVVHDNQPVPEPATLLLLGAGPLGIARARFRKKG